MDAPTPAASPRRWIQAKRCPRLHHCRRRSRRSRPRCATAGLTASRTLASCWIERDARPTPQPRRARLDIANIEVSSLHPSLRNTRGGSGHDRTSQHYHRAVAFQFEWTDSTLRVVLPGWDRMANFRRIVEIDRPCVAATQFFDIPSRRCRRSCVSRTCARRFGVASPRPRRPQ